ncbi:tetratricopeptide repeat protein [Nocardia sp. NPDC056100]|uniref:tetratricopeptide repeat protein n=1 Tax=Nocardia sp. NPDC056100 TaxID=3345712 RepID=UPI0035DC4412
MTSYTESELNEALRIADGAASIERVKDIVSDALLAADPSARVMRTEYFNHTYIPDLVVEWPSRGTNSLRRVYLRPTQDPGQIDIDIKERGSTRPVFVHLSALLPQHNDISLEHLSATARSAQSLVTEIGSFERLAEHSTAPGARLLPSSVLRGGRGLLESAQATAAAQTISRGFAGAILADPESTGSALATLESVLAPSTAVELTSVLETMWIASGAPLSQFPRPRQDWTTTPWSAPLSPDRLRALLRAVSPELHAFWRTIGHQITLDSFEGMNILGDDQLALQSIMESALDNLTARTCRILDSAGSENIPDTLTWHVQHGQLSLAAFGRRSWFGQRSEDFPAYDSSDDRRPTPQGFTDVAVRADISITRVDLANGSRTLSFGSKDGNDIIGDDMTASFAQNLGEGTVVDRAVALVESRPVTVDFATGTTFGRPNARLKAANLLWTTWTMLAGLTKSQWASFSRTIRQSEAGDPHRVYLESNWHPATFLARSRPAGELTTRLSRLRNELDRNRIPETDFRQAAQSGDYLAMLLLGMLLESKDETVEAEMWFRNAIEPTSGEAMVALASLLERQGQRVEAERWYRRASNIDFRA